MFSTTSLISSVSGPAGCSVLYLVKECVAIGGVFGEGGGPTHQGFVHAIAVVRHAHAPLVQLCLLLQQGAWEGKEKQETREEHLCYFQIWAGKDMTKPNADIFPDGVI